MVLEIDRGKINFKTQQIKTNAPVSYGVFLKQRGRAITKTCTGLEPPILLDEIRGSLKFQFTFTGKSDAVPTR